MHKKIKIQDKSLLCSIYTWRLNMPRAHTAINHVIGLFIYLFGFVSLTYQYRDHKLCLQTMAQFDTHVIAINL